MSMDNMQLKEESLLGGQQVLSDINPITNTLSIDDSASGEKLNITIARMWEAINNKLSRVVNSVNGRSGVVVLTSDDVGLGNVDNVSFYDIKQWVIDQIESVFGNKRLRLYETFQNAMDAKDSNDRALAWAPFYCDHYDNDDTRSVIGMFGWDSGSQTLTIDYRRINTIGFADNSIIYRTTPNDYGSEYGIPVGGIGVNIYNEEREEDQVLYVEGRNDSSVDKRSAGLRIDHNKLGSRVYYCETPYGNVVVKPDGSWNFSEKSDQFLYRYGTDTTAKGYRVKIYINDQYITPKYIPTSSVTSSEVIGDPYFFINNEWKEYDSFRANDIIIIRFANFIRTTPNTSGEYYALACGGGVCVDFSNRQPMIGYVSKASSDDYDFDIHFHDLRPNTHGFGITTYDTMRDRDVKDTVLGIRVFESSDTPTNKSSIPINMSGLNAQYLYNNGKFQSEADRHTATQGIIHASTPWGIDATADADGSLSIETDDTICVQARYQRYPTYQRKWFTPYFVQNKYYARKKSESGEYIYELLETIPSFWNANWDRYYVKDPNDDTSYIHAIGIPPAYARSYYSADKFTGSTTEADQYATGSLMGTNYSYNRIIEHGQYSDWWAVTSGQVLDLDHPEGTNPDDGIVSSHSEISLNLTKISFLGDEVPGKTTYGYKFYNLSGLKIDAIDNENGITTGGRTNYTNEFFISRGMADMRDAYGHSVKGVFDRGSNTPGVSVNVGRFLEITPKKTHRAETYWDGGKVQVRVGKGLTEQVEEYDVSDLFKNDTQDPPADYPFNRNQFIEAWYTHSDEFYLRVTNDDEFVDFPCVISHHLLESKPDDWDTDWTKYEYNIGTNNDPDYVFLPKIPDTTIGFNPTDQIYMGPYYKPIRISPYGCMTVKEVHDWYAAGIYDNMRIIWKRPTNRITLDLDKNTLDFDEHGKITVVGGTGGGSDNQQPGRNIRVVDTRGIYFDTMPYVIDSDTGLPKYPVEEVMSLGPGLKLTGAGVKVPITMKLWGYVKDAPVSSKRATYSTLLLEIWDNMSVGERATYFRNYCMDDNQGLGPIYIGNVLTYNGFKSFSDTVRNAIKLLPNTTTGYSQDDFDMDITQTAADFQEMITSQEVVAYNDDSYNIPTYQYLKSDVRPYLSMSADDIRDMLENLLLGVESMYDGTNESIPEDWDNKKIKILQYFADHYGMGTVSSLDHDVNMAMWNSKLPYINDQPHISTDPFPLDWAFSFFAQAILVGGEWRRIVEGRYEWTAVTSRPGTWDTVITGDYTTNSLNYFFSADDNKKPNTELLIVPEYKPTAFWVIHDITLENGWRLEFDNLSGSSVSEWNTTYAQYAFMTTFRKLEDSNAPGDWETNYSKYYTINRLNHGSDPNTGSPLILKHVESDTTPTYAPNVYYVQDNAGTIKAWIRIDRRVAYNSDEIGTASNPVRYAPTFETNKYYKKIAVEGGDPTYQLLEAKPNDWYTNFMSYFTKYDVSAGESTYDRVIGSVATVYASITAPGNYWTRSLAPTT